MTTPIRGLEERCPVCERVNGDHTLREWAECLGTPTTDLPYEDTPDDIAAVVAGQVRERFQLAGDTIVADHVVVHAAVLSGEGGGLGLKIPALIHEFQIGIAGRPPVTVAKVVFMGDRASMRAYGRLARDSANGAANAAERAA